jgi:uncharacterized phiE125 gp8 family phage protein
MRWDITTPPAQEPLTYAQVKEQCILSTDIDQTFLTRMITVVRAACEKRTGRALITRTITATWYTDDLHQTISSIPFIPLRVKLPIGPVQAITSVTDSFSNVIDPSTYQLTRIGTVDFLKMSIPIWPLTVVYTAGFGDSPSSIPPNLIQGMLMHAAHLWRYREVATDVKQEIVAEGLDALYAPDSGGDFL